MNQKLQLNYITTPNVAQFISNTALGKNHMYLEDFAKSKRAFSGETIFILECEALLQNLSGLKIIHKIEASVTAIVLIDYKKILVTHFVAFAKILSKKSLLQKLLVIDNKKSTKESIARLMEALEVKKEANRIKASLKKNRNLGKLMKTYRISKGVIQSDIKELSERQLRRYENNKQKPTVKTLEKISHQFGLTVQEYLQQLEKVKI